MFRHYTSGVKSFPIPGISQLQEFPRSLAINYIRSSSKEGWQINQKNQSKIQSCPPEEISINFTISISTQIQSASNFTISINFNKFQSNPLFINSRGNSRGNSPSPQFKNSIKPQSNQSIPRDQRPLISQFPPILGK